MPGDVQYDHRDRCAIVGIGQTDYSRNSGRSDLTLATQAALAAIDDAGLTPADIDGIVRCDMDTVRHDRPHRRRSACPTSTYWADVGPGGVAAAAMVGQAVGAILSGQATTVLVFRELNGRSGRRYGLSSATIAAGRRRRHLRRVVRAVRAAHARARCSPSSPSATWSSSARAANSSARIPLACRNAGQRQPAAPRCTTAR